MAPHQDDAVLPEADLSSSSQDDEEEDDVVDDDDEEDDVDDEDDVLNDDVINSVSPSTSSAGAMDSLPVAIATPTVTVALPSRDQPPLALATPTAVVSNDAELSADPKRHAALASQPEEKKPAALDDSRRLFQRLWTDEDEIELLQGFLDYTTQRGSKGSHGQNDTALFYDQIKSKLQLDFNKNQLVEKLRRLKKKYRNVLNKIASGKEVSFKSPHDQATFEISRKIWSNVGRIGPDDAALDDDDPSPNPNNPNFNSNYEIKHEETAGLLADKKSTPRSRKRSRTQSRADEKPARGGFVEPSPVIRDNNNSINTSNNGAGGNYCSNCNVQGLVEETVRSCLSPLFKELLNGAMGGGPSRGVGGLALNPIPFSFGGPSMNLNFGGGEVADDKWRKQQILELEVYSKRLELVQNQINVALEDLRSNGGG